MLDNIDFIVKCIRLLVIIYQWDNCLNKLKLDQPVSIKIIRNLRKTKGLFSAR